MLFSCVFLFFLSILVIYGMNMITTSNLASKEKRDSLIVIILLFALVVSLNEIQN